MKMPAPDWTGLKFVAKGTGQKIYGIGLNAGNSLNVRIAREDRTCLIVPAGPMHVLKFPKDLYALIVLNWPCLLTQRSDD